MDLVNQYISKIEHHLNVLVELEKEYHNRSKSKIYLEKRRHNKNAIEHWKNKLNRLGRESTILLVKFYIPKELPGDICIYKQYRTLYVGINEDIAKQLVLIDNPKANNLSFKIIQPGILKEI
mgnify:CR=1 FL=1